MARRPPEVFTMLALAVDELALAAAVGAEKRDGALQEAEAEAGMEAEAGVEVSSSLQEEEATNTI